MIKTLFQISFIAVLIMFFYACQPVEKTPLELLPLFSDHMVLQQEEQVNIWGDYTHGEKVSITGSWGKSANGISDADGKWKAQLATPRAGGPYEIEIVTADSTIVFKDVMIGEVWIASGQSNMEMPLEGWPPNDPILNSAEEIVAANYNAIRMFTVPRKFSARPQDDIEGDWQICNPSNAPDFSATAYFFAQRLHQQLQVPIGIIHTSWGGTVAEAWTSSEALRTIGDFDGQLDAINDPESLQKSEAWYERWTTQDLPSSKESWTNLSLGDESLSVADYDMSDWPQVDLPGRLDAIDNWEMDGAIWIRRTFDIEDISADYTLSLGAIDDADVTYINGQKVGGMNAYNINRNYKVDKSLLLKGQNTIAIRVVDTGGPGSVSGDMALSNNKNNINLGGSWHFLPVAEIYNGQFYKYNISERNYKERPNITSLHQNAPSTLYNAMLAPIIGYNVEGAIWYQGESNVGRAGQYESLFPTLIEDWRTRWKDDFSFYFVQLAPFRYQGDADASRHLSQKLRDAQRKTLSLDKTGMAVTLDIGNYTNIHPSNKQDVGLRLASLALMNDYNMEDVGSGPLYKSHTSDASEIIVSFEHTGSGLMQKNNLVGFELAGEDKIFAEASARIVDDKVVVSTSSIDRPIHVRYAWRDDPVASLFNNEGLPASSFSSL